MHLNQSDDGAISCLEIRFGNSVTELFYYTHKNKNI